MKPMEPMKPMKPMEPMQGMKPMEPMKPMAPPDRWWPEDLGSPSSTGSQNETRYAYFATAHRLLVDQGSGVTTYDTGDHDIQGFGQQQSGASSLTFQSDQGTVDLKSLKQVR